MQDYYAARAPEYDAVYLKPERQPDLREIERWLPDVLAGRSVLEIACGTGYWTERFAPRCPRVVAVDAALPTIEIAKGRVPPERVEFVVADAYQLPCGLGDFDAGFAGFWWSHIPRSRVAEFLEGFHARLAVGARVVMLDNRFVPGSSTPLAGHDDEGNTFQVRALRDGTSHRVLKNFPTRQDLTSAVSPYATSLRYREWTHYWALEYEVAQHGRRSPNVQTHRDAA